MELVYCKKCVIPNTKPHIAFDQDGVCSACQSSQTKQRTLEGIDWEARAKELKALIHRIQKQKAPFYDAMVPVSGGKDSITQVHRLLNQGLRILAVNVDYGVKTEIGRRNLERIPEMGANLIIIRPNMEVHKRLLRIGFEDYGDPDLLSHTMLHAFPLHIAIRFAIPLAFLGENSAFEYGGPQELAESNRMTRAWFDLYAANNGITPRTVSEKYSISYDNLWQYDYPAELDASTVTPVFSSYFFFWDSEVHLEIAKKYGFESLPLPREGTYRTYVGIDEMINRVHQYQKVLKFGYGRATDHACEDIRAGRFSRDEGKQMVAKYDLQPLGDDYIAEVSAFMGYSPERFIEILEVSRNLDIWRQDQSGNWFIPGHLQN